MSSVPVRPRSSSTSSAKSNKPSSRPASRNFTQKDVAEKRQVVGQYMLGKTIGEGTFGKVKLAVHMPSGEKVAVKILEKSRIKEAADVRRVNREIKILKKARHANIIQLYEVLDTSHAIYLIMECAEGGEMFDFIVAQKHVPEIQACKFFHQIIDGLEMLHNNEITHRDLKPENLLLKASPDGWIVKIVDFGLSNTHEGGRLLATACGSPCYAAPEMIAGKKYFGPLADLWSIGVILFALVCGYLPFEDNNTAILYKKILSGDYKPAKWLSPEVKDLIRRILEVDPNKRYTITDIRQHPWYRQVPEADIPHEVIYTAKEELQSKEEILSAMGKAGMDITALLDALSSHTCNSLTAMYHLLQQKYRTSRLKIQQQQQQSQQPQPTAPVQSSSQQTQQQPQQPQQPQQQGTSAKTHTQPPTVNAPYPQIATTTATAATTVSTHTTPAPSNNTNLQPLPGNKKPLPEATAHLETTNTVKPSPLFNIPAASGGGGGGEGRKDSLVNAMNQLHLGGANPPGNAVLAPISAAPVHGGGSNKVEVPKLALKNKLVPPLVQPLPKPLFEPLSAVPQGGGGGNNIVLTSQTARGASNVIPSANPPAIHTARPILSSIPVPSSNTNPVPVQQAPDMMGGLGVDGEGGNGRPNTRRSRIRSSHQTGGGGGGGGGGNFLGEGPLETEPPVPTSQPAPMPHHAIPAQYVSSITHELTTTTPAHPPGGAPPSTLITARAPDNVPTPSANTITAASAPGGSAGGRRGRHIVQSSHLAPGNAQPPGGTNNVSVGAQSGESTAATTPTTKEDEIIPPTSTNTNTNNNTNTVRPTPPASRPAASMTNTNNNDISTGGNTAGTISNTIHTARQEATRNKLAAQGSLRVAVPSN